MVLRLHGYVSLLGGAAADSHYGLEGQVRGLLTTHTGGSCLHCKSPRVQTKFCSGAVGELLPSAARWFSELALAIPGIQIRAGAYGWFATAEWGRRTHCRFVHRAAWRGKDGVVPLAGAAIQMARHKLLRRGWVGVCIQAVWGGLSGGLAGGVQPNAASVRRAIPRSAPIRFALRYLSDDSCWLLVCCLNMGVVGGSLDFPWHSWWVVVAPAHFEQLIHIPLKMMKFKCSFQLWQLRLVCGGGTGLDDCLRLRLRVQPQAVPDARRSAGSGSTPQEAPQRGSRMLVAAVRSPARVEWQHGDGPSSSAEVPGAHGCSVMLCIRWPMRNGGMVLAPSTC